MTDPTKKYKNTLIKVLKKINEMEASMMSSTKRCTQQEQLHQHFMDCPKFIRHPPQTTGIQQGYHNI